MIKNIILGFIIGLGKIIPGVSGSMIAISFGIYNTLIESILHPFKNIKFILSIVPGFLFAIVFGSNIITYFLNNYNFLTIVFFIGLISGGIPKIITKAYEKPSLKTYISTLVALIITLLLTLINKNTNQVSEMSYPFIMIIGLIEAVTTIVPGISGTAILMIIGCYDDVMYFFNNLLNFNMFLSTIKFGIPYIFGILIGAYIISKVVSYMTKNCENTFYSIICGLAFSSIILMFKSIFILDISLFTLLESIVLLTLGYVITSKFDK